MNQDKQPEALRIANSLQKRYDLFPLSDEFAAVAELNRQHARIAELEAELAAVKASISGLKKRSDDWKWRALNAEAAPAAQAQDVQDAVRQAVRDYHYALDIRRHGGTAGAQALAVIQEALGMNWVQGAEANRRAAIAASAKGWV